MILIRRRVQFIMRVFMFLSLGAAIGAFVVIFTGTGNERLDDNLPLVAKLLAPIILAGTYFMWSGVSYLYASAVFRLTPEGRSRDALRLRPRLRAACGETHAPFVFLGTV
ncbi:MULTISPECIES: hypothetical protein [Roseobacteraceae]|uniref:Uncharacterized protein n=1 Tax=Pseudosulfitobacter pseudonitzschiae TaxID=1402135 RepID=A0A221K827_9RHOB|nr:MULTISPECIES: hypothetical protein [Roseobacteraceae]ASM75136.1 hypothetical protein SULPSESMR1_04415 [Pseudosulfitobacter pseudonitzschiae]